MSTSAKTLLLAIKFCVSPPIQKTLHTLPGALCMLSVNLTTNTGVGFQAATAQTKAAAAAETNPLGDAPAAGVKVDLSTAGIAKSKAAQPSDDDTANPVKVLEKRIKEIQKQMAELQARLQAIEANKHLTVDQKQAEAGAVQSQLAQLSSALGAATTALAKLIEQQAQNAANKGSAAAVSTPT
ncbi:hypothetical protein [Pseudomonas sp. NA-150]|uniref:hypothetical protein n=1 Tax=Pseudomonas sp. NA-150 TaxID=3367525 RepID=UPI0037C56CC9